MKFFSDYGNDIYFYSIGQEKKNYLGIFPFCFLLISFLVFSPFLFFSCYLYLNYLIFRNARLKRTRHNFSSILIVRSYATDEKVSRIHACQSISLYSEDILFKSKSHPSMFQLLSLLDLSFLSVSYVKTVILELPLITLDLIRNREKLGGGRYLFGFFLRVPFKVIYEIVLDKILSFHNVESLSSGNKEDRYAVLEYRLSKRYGINSICYPHGLEYSFRPPQGLFGDVFYCTSPQAKRCLEKLYPEKSVIFDLEVCKKMFTRTSMKISIPGTVVFFTEGRGVHTNCLIIEALKRQKVDFFVALHPKDNMNNYQHISGLKYLNSKDISLEGVFCLCRKSSILVDALYNDGIPIALLLDEYDKKMYFGGFPSLQDENIKKFSSMDELFKYLVK
ncbi:hypothetical protein WKW58_07645 [Vibrio alginolyticus]|uniref:hypothetical protein n=1 Tax=Vibrio alginolyticus TaxID=663 RepID=UPI0030584B85